MSSIFSLGEVMSCVDGEILLYGWLDAEEAIKSIEDFFDEVIERSDIKDIQLEYWKFVPKRNDLDGYPGLYYPCENGTMGAFKATRVFLK